MGHYWGTARNGSRVILDAGRQCVDVGGHNVALGTLGPTAIAAPLHKRFIDEGRQMD
jgi:hypothetical protein